MADRLTVEREDKMATGDSVECEAAAQAELDKLRNFVAGIKAGAPANPSSPEVERLISAALRRAGTPEDIERWAHELALQTAELAD